ncbi:hypothetical protein [Brevibacillus daliensis]|uniref:hypothetical protein n=1 Tax=Brevibacillus daliensis TaxID=2892995 RepID=UPI001E5143B6|nr:hypothetical protein [Brevibacillus daliensis]
MMTGIVLFAIYLLVGCVVWYWTLEGKDIELYNIREKVVALVFWLPIFIVGLIFMIIKREE